MPKITRMIILVLFMYQIIGCNQNSDSEPTSSEPAVLTLEEMYPIMPSRYDNFKGALSVSLEVENIDWPDRILVKITFSNLSVGTLVFREPITYGFTGVDGGENDLGFVIEMKNGPDMAVTSTSNYTSYFGVSTAPEVTQNDFIGISPGEIVSYQADIAFPPIYIKEWNYSKDIPPGIYKLRVKYTNIDIGYTLPFETPPPKDFKDYQARREWYDTNTMVVDLNAWVGRVWSEDVEFTILAE